MFQYGFEALLNSGILNPTNKTPEQVDTEPISCGTDPSQVGLEVVCFMREICCRISSKSKANAGGSGGCSEAAFDVKGNSDTDEVNASMIEKTCDLPNSGEVTYDESYNSTSRPSLDVEEIER
ncbi:hypothetical protein ACEPAH_3923 [Sanghuangporus vaninii]